MKKIERFDIYMNIKKLNDNKVTQQLGLSVGILGKSRKEGRDLSDRVVEQILNYYTDLNQVWLLTGEGEMLKGDKTDNSPTYGTVPLLPVSAQGGTLNDYVVSVRESDCERITTPIKGVDFAITVSGESMSPKYPSGSYVFIKKIDGGKFIEWGRVYVLDTCNGTVVKKIMPSEKEGCVRCVSFNPEYPPFDVAMGDIIGMYRVLLSMTLE